MTDPELRQRLQVRPDGMTAAKLPTRVERVAAWTVALAALALVASVAAVALCGAAVVVKLTADFLTH